MNDVIYVIAQYGGNYSGGSPLGISMGYWVLIGGTMLASMLVGQMLKKRFREYSQEPMPLTGAQVAEKMLNQNGIRDVQVVSVQGHLTDHYNPANKTVNLSESVYKHNSVAAAAVAAHECGHAIQHAKAYMWLGLRSKMVPMVNIASSIMPMFMLGMIGGFATMNNPIFIYIFLAVFGTTTLFAFITLPVEFDASRRALVWIKSSGLTHNIGYDKAKNALFWAAMTYVVGALSSLATLLYYAMMFLGRRD